MANKPTRRNMKRVDKRIGVNAGRMARKMNVTTRKVARKRSEHHRRKGH